MTHPSPLPAPQHTISRWLIRLGAILCFATAGIIIMIAGLPDRATATALYTLPDGRSVAPEVGAIAPPLELISIDGEKHTLTDLHGQVVIINYWATWCAPCRVEMPALQAIADRYPSQVVVWGVNAGEPEARIRAWQGEFMLRFPLLLDPDGTAAGIYRLRGQPTTVIVAPDGRIRDILYGPADITVLEQAVVALLSNVIERPSP